MKSLKHLVTVVASLMVLAGCAKPSGPHTDAAADEAAVRAQLAAWYAADNAKDADAKAAVYAEDAVLYIPDAAPIRGRAAIRERFGKDFAEPETVKGINNVDPNAEFGCSGDLCWEAGHWSETDSAGAGIANGNYVTVYGRREGKWLIIRDIWNAIETEAPAETAAAAPPT